MGKYTEKMVKFPLFVNKMGKNSMNKEEFVCHFGTINPTI
jgi:hypothetical protein